MHSTWRKGLALTMLMALLVQFGGFNCASQTMIRSRPDGAKIYMDGAYKGTTPYQHEDTKIVAATTSIRLLKDGYQDLNVTLTRNEELHVGALIGGLFFFIPFLWITGYHEDHVYDLMLASTQPAALTPTLAPAPSLPSGDLQVAKHIKKVTSGTVVAVFDIIDKSNQFSREMLDQLTEYLAVQLAEVAGYRITPREQLRQKMDTDKKASHSNRIDSTYQIELGRAVAAQKTLVTKIIQIGSRCSLNATLYDLATEATDKAASYDTGCSTDALMDGVKQLAVKLSIDVQR